MGTRTFVDEDGRVCTECGIYKEWDCYYLHAHCPGGRDPKCRECTLKHNVPANRIYRDKLKKQVYAAYGGECKCCGESESAFLTIDHVNNDGADHRREGHGRANRIYRWLRDNNYPDGFQLLCANCNQAKQLVGSCPHQTARGIAYANGV